MMRVFRDAGYEVSRQLRGRRGAPRVRRRSRPPATESVMREREQHAEARSIARLLSPRSVAVVGASNDESKIGNAVFRNLLRAGLQGTLYPVNPDARHVHGVRAYPSVLEVPDDDRPRGHRGARVVGARRRRAMRAQGRPRAGDSERRLRRARRRGRASVRDGRRNGGWSRWRGPMGCGSSGRIASAWSTPSRRCG